MNAYIKSYIESYKRGVYEDIPIYEDETGMYFLSEKQLNAIRLLTDGITKRVGLGGAARGGKSALLCFWQLFNRLSYPGTRGFIGRLELKNLNITTAKTLFELMNYYGIEKGIDYNHDQQKNIIQFWNKSEILLMDTKFPEKDQLFTRFGSLELTDAAIDESNETREGVVNKIYSRTGWCLNDKYGLPRKTLETFNPEKNHIYRRFWKPYRDKVETPEIRFIPALPADNPHPSIKEWIEDVIKIGDKRMTQRLIHGNFDYDDDDNALVNFEKIADLFTNTFIPDEGQNFLSCDIAISNDYFVAVRWKGMRIKEIFREKNISPTQIETRTEEGVVNNKIDYTPILNKIKSMAEKGDVPRSNIIYDGDGIGHQIIKLLPGAIPIFNNSKPTRPEYKNLKCELEYELARRINSSEIFIEPDLSADMKDYITEELQMIKRDSEPGVVLATMKKAIIKELLGRSPDIMDAVKYRLLFKLTRNR